MTIDNVTFIAVCASFITICSALSWAYKITKKVKEPSEMQDKQIKENSDKIADHEERLETQEEQGKLLMQGMLALLNHSIDGNNTDQMKNAKNDIQKFLIEK